MNLRPLGYEPSEPATSATCSAPLRAADRQRSRELHHSPTLALRTTVCIYSQVDVNTAGPSDKCEELVEFSVGLEGVTTQFIHRRDRMAPGVRRISSSTGSRSPPSGRRGIAAAPALMAITPIAGLPPVSHPRPRDAAVQWPSDAVRRVDCRPWSVHRSYRIRRGRVPSAASPWR